MKLEISRAIRYNGVSLLVDVNGQDIDLIATPGINSSLLKPLVGLDGLYFVGDGCEVVFKKLLRDRKVTK